MNKIATWFSSRFAMALAMVFSMAYASAANVLSIDPVTFDSQADVTVAVNLNSTDQFRTLLFDITLPEGVSIKGTPEMAADRLDLMEGETPADFFNIQINQNPNDLGNNVWRIGLFGMDKEVQILPGKGEVVSLTLAISEDAYLAGGEFEETITANLTDGLEGDKFTVTINAPEDAIANVTLPEEIEVNTGEKAQVAVSLENNLPVSVLKFDIVLPEDITLAKNGRKYEFTYGARWNSDNSISVTDNETSLRVIVSNMKTNVIAVAGEGELFSFYVVCGGEKFKAEFQVTGINASMKWNDGEGVKNIDVYSPDQTVSVINATALAAAMELMEEDQELVNEYVNTYAQFVEETGKDFPAFLELNKELCAEVYAKIEALNDAFVKAQEDADAAGQYVGLTAEQTSEVTDAIMGLVTKEAEELAKIENGKIEDLEALKAYAEKVAPIIDEEVVYNDEIFTEAQNFFGELTKYSEEVEKAEAAAKNETGEYVSPLTEEVKEALAKQYEAIEAQVNEIIAGQIEEDQEIINELATTYAAFVEATEEEFPAFLVVKEEEVAAVYNKIEALNDAFVKAQEEAYENGVYNGVSTEQVTEVREALIGLIALEAEELAKIENGMVEDQSTLAEYSYKLDAIVEGEVVYNEAIELQAVELMAKLYELSNKVYEAEAKAKQETGVYESPLTEEVMAEIEKAANDIEEGIVEHIMGQIEEDQAVVNELAVAYSEFTAEVEKEFPAFLTLRADEVAAVYAQIEALNEAFVKAQEAAEETGVYEGLSTEDVINATEALLGLEAQEAEDLTMIENAMMEDMEALAVFAEVIDPILEDDEDVYSEDVVMFAYNIMGELYNYSNEVWAAEAKAKQETGEYVSPLNDEIIETLAKEVAELEEMIKTTGLNSMFNDGAEAIYYDLNGFVVKEPAAGKIYIKVVNGKATKVVK